jgi:hypothetical protein
MRNEKSELYRAYLLRCWQEGDSPWRMFSVSDVGKDSVVWRHCSPS